MEARQKTKIVYSSQNLRRCIYELPQLFYTTSKLSRRSPWVESAFEPAELANTNSKKLWASYSSRFTPILPPPPPASISLKDSENWMFSDRLEYGDSVLVFLCGRWDSLMVRPDRGSNRCSANAKNSALVIPPSLHSLRTTFHQIALFLVIRVGAIDDFLTADKNLFAPCPTALGAETSWIAGLIRLLYLLVVASRDTVAEHCHPPLFTSGNRALVFPKNCLL